MQTEATREDAAIRKQIVELARRARRSPPDATGDLRAWFRRVGEFGLLGMAIPEAYGGSGMGAGAAVSAFEALGYGGVEGGVAFSLGAHVWAVMMAIHESASAEQKERWLPSLCRGERIGAIALSEADSGSDVFAMRTRVARRGDGYVLDGRKAWCTNAPLADVFVVFASNGAQNGFARCSAFVIPKGTPGLGIEPSIAKMGLDASPMADVVLEGCEVPQAALLGRWGHGAAIFHETLIWERGALASPFVGVMHRQLDACVAYASERRQFGAPIGSFQAVSHRLAEMKLRLETARLLLHRFAALKDAGQEASLEASLVKLHVSESFVQSSLDAIQIHGANGYASELGVDADLRDAIGLRIASGTNDLQRSAIARALGI